MTGHVKVGGAWKDLVGASVKVGGVWKEVTNGFTKIGGVWKEWYSAANPTYELIQTVTLTSTASVVQVTGIPQTYEHLEIFFSPYADSGYSTGANWNFTWNNLSANYDLFFAYLNSGNSNETYNNPYSFYGNSVYKSSPYTANVQNAQTTTKILVPNYTKTDRSKVLKYENLGYLGEGGINPQIGVAANPNTAGVTSIKFTAFSGAGIFDAPTKVSIYGVK